MAADIPTKEPLTIRAGNTIQWTKSIDDYKASDGWTLSYSFRGTGGTIDITSSADGDDHAISIAATTTTAYTAGFHDVIGYVEKGSDRYTVYTSRATASQPGQRGNSPYALTSSVSTVHDRLNFASFNRNLGHEIDWAVLGDDDVILKANAKALVRKVNARLYSKDCTGLKRRIVVAHIMHIKAKRMAKAVHEILSAGGVIRVLLLDLALL